MARGFTLIELLIAIGLMALLAGLAAPSFLPLSQTAQLDAQSQRLVDALWYTRSQAISRNIPLTMRAVNQDWSNGWQIFTDADQNGHPRDNDSILRASAALPNGYSLSANQGLGSTIGYRPDGRSARPGGGLQMGTFTLCSQSASAGLVAREIIVISAAGRPRKSRAPSALAERECNPSF